MPNRPRWPPAPIIRVGRPAPDPASAGSGAGESAPQRAFSFQPDKTPESAHCTAHGSCKKRSLRLSGLLTPMLALSPKSFINRSGYTSVIGEENLVRELHGLLGCLASSFPSRKVFTLRPAKMHSDFSSTAQGSARSQPNQSNSSVTGGSTLCKDRLASAPAC